MRIATAQFVRSDRLKATGVNAYLRARPGSALPGNWQSDERARASQIDALLEDAGGPDVCALQIPPGGNSVLAFLDVVAADSVTQSELVALLDAHPTLHGRRHFAWLGAGETCGAHYFVSDAMRNNPATVFGQLKQALLSLAESGRGDGPLRVRTSQDGDAQSYRLDQDSSVRMVRLHGAAWQPPWVQVADIEAKDYLSLHGHDVREAIIDVLTGLDVAYVRALGGIEFVDGAGRVLFRWPS